MFCPEWTNARLHPRNAAELCEGETMTAICTPHGNVRISKKCSDSDIGRGLTAAMCLAAVEETRRTLP